MRIGRVNVRIVLKWLMLVALPVAALAACACVMEWLAPRDAARALIAQSPQVRDLGPPSMRWAGYDSQALRQWWDVLSAAPAAVSPKPLDSERKFLEIDLVSPVLYGGALALGLLLAWKRLSRPFHWGWIVVLVAVVVSADWTENLSQLALLDRYVSASGFHGGLLVHVASCGTVFKLYFGLFAFLVLVVFAVVGMAQDHGAERADERARKLPEDDTKTVEFADVRQAEWNEIWREKNGGGANPGKSDGEHLMGLALSGGGIRSATFNLGVIQGLARLGLLKEFDYLSTVSGGGYIGSWLSAWVAREGSIAAVERKLACGEERERRDEREPPESREAREIRVLREYSNYLTPKAGWLTTDTLTAIATYLRNLLLNLTIIVAVLAVVLLAPWLAGWIGRNVPAMCLLAFSMLLLAIAAVGITRNVIWQELEEFRADTGRPVDASEAPAYTRASAINLQIVLPLVLWALALSLAVWQEPGLLGEAAAGIIALSMIAMLFIVRAVCRFYARRSREDVTGSAQDGSVEAGKERPRRHHPGWRTFGMVVGTFVGVGLLVGMSKLLPGGGEVWHVVVWGVPGVLLAFLFGVTFMLGISGRTESEYGREWWSRLGGLLFRFTLGWLVLSAAAVYGPLGVIEFRQAASGLGAAWFFTTLMSVLAAKSPATGTKEPGKWIELVPKIGPYVFIIGLIVGISAALYYVMAAVYWKSEPALPSELFGAAALAQGYPGSGYFDTLSAIASPRNVLVAIVALLAVAFVLARTVDINLFSFHMFYRNRLMRCYLGASNRKRKPLPFIDFDPRDNWDLTRLARRPYHLLNVTLNLTSSGHLGWQERKAASFIFSPLYCGYQFPDVGTSGPPSDPCFRKTGLYAFHYGGSLSLGTAMTISGAAANPNMGYHSSPSVAFLLTIFNLRLGWWMQNPRRLDYWTDGGPHFGLRYLLTELAGLSNELTPFVQLSDGGHFENLGIYELVRRQCRFIVATDVSADRKFEFQDLGNAIRKCQVDLGVEIEIGKRALIPDPATGRSLFHCAVGKIHYKTNGRESAPGYLVYLKPCLTGGEPSDVLQYAAASPDFPHEGTQDQWFSESQFESYRKLGFHVVQGAFSGAGVALPIDCRQPGAPAAAAVPLDREKVFVRMKERWFPPSSAGAAAFSRLAEGLSGLQDALRSDRNLEFLNAQIYPEWQALARGATGAPEVNVWMPREYASLQAGFHFCSNMLQLMENVYVDLNLENEHEHPDNRGWMNLFHHWSWSGMLKVTYAVCCSMYGARFQRFCERQLSLFPGTLHIAEHRVAAADWKQFLANAETGLNLNFLEAEMIRKLHDARVGFDRIYLLEIIVRNPADLRKEAPDPFVYTFGFALAEGGSRIVYYRVQDHLRRMGHGRLALSRLYYKHGLTAPGLDAVRGKKACLDGLEEPDFEAFERLFRAVARQGSDFDEELG